MMATVIVIVENGIQHVGFCTVIWKYLFQKHWQKNWIRHKISVCEKLLTEKQAHHLLQCFPSAPLIASWCDMRHQGWYEAFRHLRQSAKCCISYLICASLSSSPLPVFQLSTLLPSTSPLSVCPLFCSQYKELKDEEEEQQRQVGRQRWVSPSICNLRQLFQLAS